MSDMQDPQRLCVLGATGSIGSSTLDIVARHPERYRIHALTANRDAEAMAALCARFHPTVAVMADPAAAEALHKLLGPQSHTDVCSGGERVAEAAALEAVDTVVAGIVGAAGLASCLAAVEAGKRVLVANKEALVVAGDLLMAAARRSGAVLLPIDSEHNGLFQCLPAAAPGQAARSVADVDRLILTASGGPFRTRPVDTLAAVTVDEACAHPNWSMGRKISVDSATMMNKGLEVIEACRLFDMPPEQVEVVIHPQSLVHALVQYRDGSTLAQMGQPDMRTPIAAALAWPRRVEAGVGPLDLAALGRLDFEAPDPVRFPCLELARAALEAGAASTAALNAANEIAVAAFLSGEIGFHRIATVIEATLAGMTHGPLHDLQSLLEHEQSARRLAGEQTRRWRG